MSERVAMALLVGFLLLSIQSYLATYTLGTFRLSYFRFSPTEVRILLAMGNVAALLTPEVSLFGLFHPGVRFFDAGGIVAVVCMAVVLVGATVRNTIALYRAEQL
jgi:hypothetical protein